MAKILFSPLFFVLIVLAIWTLVRLARWPRSEGGSRLLTAALAAVTLGFWLVSTPAVSIRLARMLEGPYVEPRPYADVEIVTVLSGGFFRGPSTDLDMLGASTQFRVVRGVRAFHETGADLLVFQGSLSGPEPGRVTEGMRELAVEMGVPAERIVTEPRSRNTFQHPIELLALEEVDGGERIAVVTSAWHLKRAVREFRRSFPEVVPLPAEFYSFSPEPGIRNWLPAVASLGVSTKVIHEWIGMTWYRLKRHVRADERTGAVLPPRGGAGMEVRPAS